MELSNWQLDGAIAPDAFASQKAQAAKRIAFASPAGAHTGCQADSRRSRPRRPPKRNEEVSAMKTIVSVFAALLATTLWAGDAQGWAQRQPLWRQHQPQLGLDQPRQRLGRQLVPYLGRRHFPHQRVRRQHAIRITAAPSTPTSMAAARTAATAAAPITPIRRARPTTIRPTYPVYHPPVAVPYYSSGCYGCAAAAGAIVGAAVGAAAASANTAAATSNAYAAGVATGSAQDCRRDQCRLQRRRCHRGRMASAPAAGAT